MNRQKAIFLMGPTASGKTDLAIELHRRMGVDIISVDSAQVYRGLDIGTAKPDTQTLAMAPHALIDIRNPEESYSAAEFCEDALAEMHSSVKAQRVPLLAGGTMLYFNALTHGLSDLPSADAKIRAMLEAEGERIGWGTMHARLAKQDPQAAARIHPNDPQRIQRALEVMQITGRPLSELQSERSEPLRGFDVLRIIASPEPRAKLHQRIEQRFDIMLEQGFLDEVKPLFASGKLDASMPSMRCVGYRQAWAHLEGKYDLDEMRLRAIYATRQLAKRQITWLRRETDALWYDPTRSSALDLMITEVTKFLEK